jgi:hypothetical protein
MNEWANFFTAIAGAAATLTGLIFVGVSISLSKILSLPKMPARALGALVVLVNMLIVAVLCLIPGQTAFSLGIELLFISILTWLFTLRLDVGLIKNTEPRYRKYSFQNIVFSQFAILPYIIAGIVILNTGFAGIYWLIPGIIFSFIKPVTDAWVLLIEIHR